MLKYGIVTFHCAGEKGAKFKKTLVERMNAAGVITVSESDIESWYKEDLREIFDSTHKYVLHNRKETDIFRMIMNRKEMQDESIEWRVTYFAHDRKFRKWVKGVERRYAEEEKNVKRKKV